MPLREYVVEKVIELSYLDKIGGVEALRKLIPILYENVVNNEALSPFFENMEMKTQIKTFLNLSKCILCDDPEITSQFNLKEAHQKLNITNENFNTFLKLFQISLKQINVTNKLIKEISKEKINKLKDQIISQK